MTAEQSQRATMEFTTPSPTAIVAISRKQVAMMETSDADETWVWAGMHHLLLHTVGRRSGHEHKVALPFWRDREGHRVVVASFGGAAKDPAWFLNLADRSANPQVLVRVQGGCFWADAQVLDGADHERTWAQLLADRPWYADYQAQVQRRIPLVRLVETRPA